MKKNRLKEGRSLGFFVYLVCCIQGGVLTNSIGFAQTSYFLIFSQGNDQPEHVLMITSPIRSNNMAKSRDVKYQNLLENYEKFKSVWRQQPSNLAALRRYPLILENSINSLLQTTINTPKATTPSTRTEATEATEALMEAAKGPVRPSNAPTSEDKFRKRMEATLGTHLPTHSLGNDLSRSLTLSASDAWIQQSCNVAKKELNNVDHILKADTVLTPQALNDALNRLGEVFYGINNSPPSTPSRIPKG